MDKKSKIALVVGILLSVAGLVSLVSAGALTPSPLLPCSAMFTAESPSLTVYLPFGCTVTGDERTILVTKEAIDALVGAEARQ